MPFARTDDQEWADAGLRRTYRNGEGIEVILEVYGGINYEAGPKTYGDFKAVIKTEEEIRIARGESTLLSFSFDEDECRIIPCEGKDLHPAFNDLEEFVFDGQDQPTFRFYGGEDIVERVVTYMKENEFHAVR